MKNKIFYVTSEELEKIKEGFEKENDSLFVGELDGREILTVNDFFEKVGIAFHFPTPVYNFPAYSDWIRDLAWLQKEAYVFLLYHVSDFMKDDLENKVIAINLFEKRILPWWSGDVEKYTVGGKAKPFTVYLVD